MAYAPPHRPPPLHAVRAFVAAAQHLSFTRAAAELHVTHSAISRQVKALEAHLGTALFERRVRQVVLTPAGHAFQAEAAPALERIAAAARQIAGGPDDAAADARTVRINVRPSFAVRWLIPRLPDFVAAHPRIAPKVLTTTAAPARAADAFDIAIRRGTGGWPGDWLLQPFLEDAAVVVGAPALLAARPVPQARAAAGHVLLDARSRSGDWDDWRRLHGGARQRPAGRLALDHLHLVLQAAVDGLGLAMAPLSLASHDLAAGRLVAPLPALRLPLARHYYAVAPGAPAEATVFARWLESAAQRDFDIQTPVGLHNAG
ncbi:LysR substrate-binding domain-containing protein [Xylophilus sp.]|uniref:LysR substrate-binding domain-containing protein n=1 Tax=Xylophilus sp. TaxID=2653893 RepID=UPI0013B5BCB7|nr:LysR substrate-binding domain-containing protein [Xylophilus sp.]KAF1050179.1 MAG: Glycine cleavage system transcriptional activator [Xylophilus sp.]